MITLSKRLKADGSRSGESTTSPASNAANTSSGGGGGGRASIRDQLLVKEVQEMEQSLPTGCKAKFDDPNALHEFMLSIVPEEGYWAGGKFKFHIMVPEDYNLSPPTVRCLTRLWHPNINEDGDICLSILRINAIDGFGWAPTRRLKDIIWGLSSLFGDLLNFDDPLNNEAAQHYLTDKDSFKTKVREWVIKYAKK